MSNTQTTRKFNFAFRESLVRFSGASGVLMRGRSQELDNEFFGKDEKRVRDPRNSLPQ